jgi:hypothetical protein
MTPDRRRHRGQHPEDKVLFHPDKILPLKTATSELSWLLSHNYSMAASVKIVGDHHRLNIRQRNAISRAACSDKSKKERPNRCISISDLKNAALIIDGFNLIIFIEAALSGGVIIVGYDGCLRDLSGIHGSYRIVDETEKAIDLIGQGLKKCDPNSVTWVLDKPVSNSGRLAEMIRKESQLHNYNWQTELINNPDGKLIDSEKIVISSDSHLLDKVKKWTNFNSFLIKNYIPSVWLIDFRQ